MKSEMLYEVLGDVCPQDIQQARMFRRARTPGWLRWGAAAACLCLLAAGAVRLLAPAGAGRQVLAWSEGFPAADYFRYCGGGRISESDSIAFNPFAAQRSFDDQRTRMEAEEVIPAMPEHPLYACTAGYGEDGGLLSVTFTWDRRGESYSNLSLTAGYEEVEQIRDCLVVELDSQGNIVPPQVTVTQRDGVQIVAEGSRQGKTLTFQSGAGWYRIAGSWNDSDEDMVRLLDWVWEHPVDFDLFSMDRGAEIVQSSLEETPGAFAGAIPDFEALGYLRGAHFLLLKDGEPYQFEGHYYAGVDPSALEDESYLAQEGWTEIHWCVCTRPDVYDLEESLGDAAWLTAQRVADRLSQQSSFSFTLGDCFIKVYTRDAEAAWLAVEALLQD